MCGSTVFKFECRGEKVGLRLEAAIKTIMMIMTMILPWQTRGFVLLFCFLPRSRNRYVPGPHDALSCPLAPENAKYPLPYPLSCTRVYCSKVIKENWGKAR